MKLLLVLALPFLLVVAQDAPPPKKAATLPLQAERKIQFTTDEGTWMSLDVSPDGKTVVFELLGDIYTMPISGGKAQLLIGGMSNDTQPVYSPDGKYIAFLSDRDGGENLWVARAADGSSPRQLSKDAQASFVSPAWSPDSMFVAVSRTTQQSGTAEIWMYHRDGGASGVQVTKAAPDEKTPPGERLNHLGARFSPDGKYLYFSRRKGRFSYNVTFPLWQVVRRDRVTGEEDVITEAPTSAMRPVVSPDGGKLVYVTRFETESGLRIRDLKTGEEKWLKYPIQRDDQESMASRDLYPNYNFTPDGKDIFLTFGGKVQRLSVLTGEHQTIPFTADVSLDLGPRLNFPQRVEQGAIRARLVQNPVPSSDGANIVFSALRHLYRYNPATGKSERLTKDDSAREFSPAYSPDGAWIAYVTWTNKGGDIWKIRGDGSGAPVKLTQNSAFYLQPAWSPDGSKIVAIRSSIQSQLEAERASAMNEIVWVPTGGGSATLILPARGAGRPHFVTTQPERVYLYSARGLASVRFDGSDRRTLVKLVNGMARLNDPAPVTDAQISPDGRYVVALASNQLSLMPVPQAGGETTSVDLAKPSVPVKKLTTIGADSFTWGADSKTVNWSAGSSVFRLHVEDLNFEADAAKLTPTEVAVTIEKPRSIPKGTVVLRGAKVITMKGDETIANADLVITENKVAAVGKRGAVAVPQGARIIDVTGQTIMPGIVDAHAHWRVQRDVIEEQSWSFLANLAYGVTAGRDPQTFSYDMFAYQDAVDAGEMLGPRAFSTGPGVFADTNFESYEQTKAALSRYSKYYRTHLLKSYMVGNRKQRQWVIQACKELGIMPTTEGGLDLKLNITHAVDGFSGNEHSLPILPLYKDVVELMARSGTVYTPTLLVAYGGPWAENFFFETTDVYGDTKLKRFIPQNVLYLKAARRPWFREEEHVFKRLAESAAKVVRSGGKVCIGGHGQLQGIQCHWEMWALQSGGLTNQEVLRAATLHGAEALGYAQDLGSIEVGKLADLLVLRKDPLENIRNTNTIRYVMKNGDLFDGESMDQVWPVEKKLPDQWWWHTQPGK